MKKYYIYRTKNNYKVFSDSDQLEMHIRIQLHRGIYDYTVEQSCITNEGIPGCQSK